MTSTILVLVLLAANRAGSPLDSVLAATPGDSLARPLRQLEVRGERGTDPGETALVLGQFHFARGEYRQAAETLARAAARLAPPRKLEARYWQGLALLAVQQTEEARGVLSDVAAAGGARRADAELGVAWTWEQAHRPDKALDVLDDLIASGAGEAGPAALERTVALAGELGQNDRARRARERLLKEYPRSVEAARVAPADASVARGDAFTVQIGAYGDADAARKLADRARRAGFDATRIVTRGDGAQRVNVVEIGGYPTRDAAMRAGARAANVLGVRYQLEAGR